MFVNGALDIDFASIKSDHSGWRVNHFVNAIVDVFQHAVIDENPCNTGTRDDVK